MSVLNKYTLDDLLLFDKANMWADVAFDTLIELDVPYIVASDISSKIKSYVGTGKACSVMNLYLIYKSDSLFEKSIHLWVKNFFENQK